MAEAHLCLKQTSRGAWEGLVLPLLNPKEIWKSEKRLNW
jgi:hypothetical protein